jgi:NAD-dependent dihydropyrimidine dehydrogenase PreA subunit
MFECQQNTLTPEFLDDLDEYFSSKAFGIDFLSTKLPQLRTIPIKESITPQHNASTYDEITSLLQQAEGPFAILECICRNKKSMQGEPCKVTNRKETCLAIGEMSKLFIEMGAGRGISKDEVFLIIEQNQKEGLVLQPSNTKDIDFVCSCCGCCCGILNMHKGLPKPLDYWATNYFAIVDEDTCKGCGNCEKSCQVDAIKVPEKGKSAVVNLDRCIGCGICISKCPTGSVSLSKKSKETSPPQTREELWDIIALNKKGKFGKMLITGKLIFDAIRSGQSHLLK